MKNLLNLTEAAAFLRMSPDGLRKKAVKGEIPGAKPGKIWCFCQEDLVCYIRSFYSKHAKTAWSAQQEEKLLWHSTKEVIHGGFQSAKVVDAYNGRLGLQTKSQRNGSTTR